MSSATEYADTFGVIVNQARVLDMLPLDKMLATVERAEAVGPVFHPSEWIKGQKNLQPQREILQAAIAFRDAVRRCATKQEAEKR